MPQETAEKVLVIGDNDLAGLTTVRSLGRMGLEVHLVAFERPSITRWSRYVRRVHDFGHPLLAPAAFADQVLTLVRDERFDLAIPTSDKGTLPLLSRCHEIEEFTRLVIPDGAAFTAANDKAATLDLAERLGIPKPRTQVLRTPADVERFTPPDVFPIVLKPTRSVLPDTQTRNEVAIVRSAEELFARLPAMVQRCPVLVQEFCPGFGVGLVLVADRGEIIGALQHERVHEPPSGGASSYRRTVPLSPHLLDWSRRFCAAVNWTGPAMVEFKVRRDTGEAVLMEVNGRLWGSLALAVQAGFDVPRILYDLYVRKVTRPSFAYRTPFYVRHTTRDLEWLLANFRVPTGRHDLLRKSATEVLAEAGHWLRGREGHDLESWRDPLPAVRAWCAVGERVVAALGRRIRVARHRGRARRQATRLAHDAAFRERCRRAESVLFVCHGNINRSAVAAARLRTLSEGFPRSLTIASAGLLPRSGATPGPTAVAVARELGIELTGHRSQPLTRELLERFDLIVAMEVEHLAGIARLAPRVADRTFLLPVFAPEELSEEIADPDGGSPAVFHRIFGEVLAGVDGMARLFAEPSGVLTTRAA